jgi:lysophospholipid hydrolase
MEESVREFLRTSELFCSVNPQVLEELLPKVRSIELSDGQPLVSDGDADQNLYLLMSGRLRVIGSDRRHGRQTQFEVIPGQTVREMAFFSDDRVSGTILSAAKSRVLALSQEVFEDFTARHADVALQVMESLSARLHKSRLTALLHQIPPFDALDPEVLRDLEQELEMLTLYGGEVLFRQDDVGDSLYIVIRGRLRASLRDKDGQEVTVADLGSGELVGEMAVVTGESRSASVVAVRDTQLAKLTRSGFEHFMMKHPHAAVETISRKLAQRLRDTTANQRPWSRAVSTIALIPAQPDAPLSPVAAALHSALAKFGPTLRLNSSRVDERLGRAEIAQTYERSGRNIRLVEWLDDQETTHEYVIYESDSFLSQWTERCVRQADHVLVVGSSDSDPTRGDVEFELLGALDGRKSLWLILVHGDGEPSGTNKWLDGRVLKRHFHVRLGQENDFDRVARFLTGRAIGLTLGGGFARALAHAGVFRAFTELGIPIDAVGGASMGALIGAMWVMGWDLQKMVAEVCTGCSRPFSEDLTFPFIAMKAGKSFGALVRRIFGDVQIEDLWIPYFCISANLNRSELRIHTHGQLAKAVLATTRAPGVLPPVVYEGELHVDGGVINNVPVDIMKAFCNEGITFGVDVSPPHELNPIWDYGDEVNGWAALWKRLNLFSKKNPYTPSILLVMIRTLEFCGISNKSLRLKCADLYLSPDLLKFKRTDFHLADGIVNAGYDCARKNALQWLSDPDLRARRPDLPRSAPEPAASGSA